MKQPSAHLLPGFQPPPATSAWLCHGELSPLTAAAGALRALGASLASKIIRWPESASLAAVRRWPALPG